MNTMKAYSQRLVVTRCHDQLIKKGSVVFVGASPSQRYLRQSSAAAPKPMWFLMKGDLAQAANAVTCSSVEKQAADSGMLTGSDHYDQARIVTALLAILDQKVA